MTDSQPIAIGVRALIIQKDKVLLVQQTNRFGKVIYLLPGGGVNQNESLRDAVIREIKEETSLSIEPLDISFVREMFSAGRITYEFIFSTKNISGDLSLGYDPEQQGLEPKLKGVVFFPIAKINEIELYPIRLKQILMNQDNKENRKIFLDKEIF